jgi:hypothetical protein
MTNPVRAVWAVRQLAERATRMGQRLSAILHPGDRTSRKRTLALSAPPLMPCCGFGWASGDPALNIDLVRRVPELQTRGVAGVTGSSSDRKRTPHYDYAENAGRWFGNIEVRADSTEGDLSTFNFAVELDTGLRNGIARQLD